MRLIPLVMLLTLAALPAAADTVVLPAAADTTIYENFDDSGNGSGEWFFAGVTNTGAIRRALIRFDLSALPPGTQIQSVSLRLGLSRGNGSNPTVGMHKITQEWTEGGRNSDDQEGAPGLALAEDATWRFRSFPTLEWTNLGGDFVPTASASLTVPSPHPTPGVITSHTWASTPALVADVQGWVNAPGTNFGWMLKSAETPGRRSRRFNSRTNIEPPQLTVIFLAAPMFADGFESGDTSGWSLTQP